MASIPAEEVAKEVLETIRKGKIPNLGKIALKKGYSKATSKNPQQIKNAKSYQAIINPLAEALEKERNRIIVALSKKNLSKEKYRDLIEGLDKITKNHQLITGGKTEDFGLDSMTNDLKGLISKLKK